MAFVLLLFWLREADPFVAGPFLLWLFGGCYEVAPTRTVLTFCQCAGPRPAPGNFVFYGFVDIPIDVTAR